MISRRTDCCKDRSVGLGAEHEWRTEGSSDIAYTDREKDERFPRDRPKETPAGPSTAEDRTTRMASLDHVYLLGAGSPVLERRTIGLPYPFITLCYVLSGDVPRELMRIARGVFDVRNDVRFGSGQP